MPVLPEFGGTLGVPPETSYILRREADSSRASESASACAVRNSLVSQIAVWGEHPAPKRGFRAQARQNRTMTINDVCRRFDDR
jgi:hypothetical protein